MTAPLRNPPHPWEFDYWTPDPWWAGQTVFVLASGPSLTQEICDRVRGRNAIVINASFKLAPWAGVWFFTDSGFYENFRAEVKAWPGEVITMSRTAKRELNERVKRVRGEGDPTLPIRGFPPLGHHSILQGRSSGHTAISLAIALGATTVGLLGFDMRIIPIEDPETKAVIAHLEHHHQEYTGPRDINIYAREFVPAFAGWDAAAKAAGVEIVNCTSGSAVTEFRFADLDEVLACARS